MKLERSKLYPNEIICIYKGRSARGKDWLEALQSFFERYGGVEGITGFQEGTY